MRFFLITLLLFTSCFAHEFSQEQIEQFKHKQQESIREQENVELYAETFLMTSSLSTTYSDEAQLMNIGVFNTPVDVISHRTDSIDPEYNWGFKVKALYRIPPTRNAISLAYTYILNNGDASLTRDTTDAFPSGIQQQNIQKDRGNQHVHLHITDFIVSRSFPMYEHISFLLGGGLTYSDLHYYFTMHDIDSVINPASSFAIDLKSQRKTRIWGVGPKLEWHFGFHFTKMTWRHDASINFALQIATMFGKIWSKGNYSATWEGTDAALPGSTGGRWDNSPRFQVIPHINADIGLRYKYELENKVSLMFTIGYRVYAYWEMDELNRTITYRLIPSSVVPDRAQEETDTAVFAGPYLRFTVGF